MAKKKKEVKKKKRVRENRTCRKKMRRFKLKGNTNRAL